MTFENERKRRINTILEVLRKAGKEGVVPQLLYQKVATEITKDRLLIYLDELSWAGLIAKGRDGKVRLLK